MLGQRLLSGRSSSTRAASEISRPALEVLHEASPFRPANSLTDRKAIRRTARTPDEVCGRAKARSSPTYGSKLVSFLHLDNENILLCQVVDLSEVTTAIVDECGRKRT